MITPSPSFSGYYYNTSVIHWQSIFRRFSYYFCFLSLHAVRRIGLICIFYNSEIQSPLHLKHIAGIIIIASGSFSSFSFCTLKYRKARVDCPGLFVFCQRTFSSLTKGLALRSRLAGSTLTTREVFSPTYTPPVKMYLIYFLPAGKKLCEAFLFIASLHRQKAHLLGSRRAAEALYQPRHAAGHRAYI